MKIQIFNMPLCYYVIKNNASIKASDKTNNQNSSKNEATTIDSTLSADFGHFSASNQVAYGSTFSKRFGL